MSAYAVYMLRCWPRDRRSPATFYTGITTDVRRRFEEHRSGKGAKYTKSRIVDACVVIWPVAAGMSLSMALRAELKIKRFSHDKKCEMFEERLAKGDWDAVSGG